jgi:hypothetical protein
LNSQIIYYCDYYIAIIIIIIIIIVILLGAPYTCVNYNNKITRQGPTWSNAGFNLPNAITCPQKQEECKTEDFVNCCKNKEEVFIANGMTTIAPWSFQNCQMMKMMNNMPMGGRFPGMKR